MMMKKLLLLIFSWGIIFTIHAQNGIIKGTVIDEATRKPIAFASVALQGTNKGAVADTAGNFLITEIAPNIYNVIISFTGYESQTLSEVAVSSTKPTVLTVELKSSYTTLKEIQVTSGRFQKQDETPLSKYSIRSAEIMRNPGGNRDISKVLQSFPGVASSVSFRNDIIIRGGAPNENRFYLDGIEVPNINHFSTQGSSGGPVGMINVNFINQVEFYSGAFPAARGNTLSSILEIKQKNGNPDRLVTNLMIGSSDIGLTFDGPLGKKANFIFSIRRSYLQFLFSALKLPFLPTYNDAQYKVNYSINEKNSITLIGLGAIDQFRLNEAVNNGVTDIATIERNTYILGYLPSNEQWNYTAGVKYTHYSENGFQNIIVSRNALNNRADKYQNNIVADSNLILNYKSGETENKIRFENTYKKKATRVTFGVNYEYAVYTTSTFNKVFLPTGITSINYESALYMNKAGAYIQAGQQLLDNKLTLSAGLRTDVSDYSGQMNNPAKQLSPRFSASYQLFKKWFFNFNTGRYFQLPAYTVLGYRDASGVLVNKNNKVTYIRCDHIVAGVEHLPDANTKISVESFFKKYANYPMLVNEQISLANLGSDFGVIGNDPVTSTSEGRSYGVEVLLQRTIKKGFYGIMAYTFVRSEFKNAVAVNYIPSSYGNPVDVTFPESFFEKIAPVLIEEIEIEAYQVSDFKVKYHQEFLKKWIKSTQQKLSFEEIWNIRELCIQKLSEYVKFA